MWRSSQLKSQIMRLRKKSLKKFRLAEIGALTCAIPVQRFNQPTGSLALNFFIPPQLKKKFIYSLFHYGVCCKKYIQYSLQREKEVAFPIQHLEHQMVLPSQIQSGFCFVHWTAGKLARPCYSQNLSRCWSDSGFLWNIEWFLAVAFFHFFQEEFSLFLVCSLKKIYESFAFCLGEIYTNIRNLLGWGQSNNGPKLAMCLALKCSRRHFSQSNLTPPKLSDSDPWRRFSYALRIAHLARSFIWLTISQYYWPTEMRLVKNPLLKP